MKIKIICLYILLVLVLCIGFGFSIMLYFQAQDEELDEAELVYEYDSFQEMVSIPMDVEVEHEEEDVPSIRVPQIELDVDELLAANSDFGGWLFIPGEKISYPVVYGENNSYYLTHSFTGYKSAYGCLFFDTQSFAGAQNRVIHGHNMGRNKDKMFSLLLNYEDQSYADEHSLICFADLSGKTAGYRLFAVVNFNGEHLEEFDFRKPNFENSDEYNNFVTYLADRSIYDSDFIPEDTELLILSTCNRQYGSSNRLLICAAQI